MAECILLDTRGGILYVHLILDLIQNRAFVHFSQVDVSSRCLSNIRASLGVAWSCPGLALGFTSCSAQHPWLLCFLSAALAVLVSVPESVKTNFLSRD